MNDSLRHPRPARRVMSSTAIDDAAIGRRIAHHRRRRGFSQRELAVRLGRSTAWVSGVERGKYHLDRLPLLSTLATVLDVEVSDLVPEDAQWLPESNEVGEDPTGLVAVMSSYRFLGVPFGVLPDAVDLSEVEARLDLLAPFVAAADHESTARALTEIVPLAEAACVAHWPVATAVDQVGAHAWRLLGRTYGTVGSVLFRLGHFSAAWLATDRAVAAAGRAADSELLLAAVLQTARLFLDDGRRTQARGAAASVVSGLEGVADRTDAEPVHLALAGTAHLMLAEVAAHGWNRGMAEDHLAAATRMAELLPDGWQGYDLDFGRDAVALHQVIVAVELQDAGEAVAWAQDLDGDQLSPQRRARLLLHWARAEILRKAPDRALRLLAKADRLDPDQTAHFPPAWRAVAELGAQAERIHDRGELATLQARVRRT